MARSAVLLVMALVAIAAGRASAQAPAPGGIDLASVLNQTLAAVQPIVSAVNASLAGANATRPGGNNTAAGGLVPPIVRNTTEGDEGDEGEAEGPAAPAGRNATAPASAGVAAPMAPMGPEDQQLAAKFDAAQNASKHRPDAPAKSGAAARWPARLAGAAASIVCLLLLA